MSDDAPEVEVEDVYELSPMQLGMLFQTLLAPGTGMFVEEQMSSVPDAVHPGLVERAWNNVAGRTAVLRSSFHWRDIQQPVQVVHRHAAIRVEYLDLCRREPNVAAAEFADFREERRRRGFDLETPPLMRVALVRLGPHDTKFLWQFHHILLDGWSAPMVLQEVMNEYVALATGRPYTPPPRRPFRHYIDWLQERDRVAAERFWRTELRGITTPTPLALDKRSGSEDARAAADREREAVISRDDSQRLRAFAKDCRVTLNTLFQGAWALLLNRYSQQQDVIFGAVVSGRPPELEGVEEMIGLFINTLPVRVRVDPDDRVSPWLLRLQSRQMESAQHDHVSTLDVQRWSDMPSGMRLFDSVLIFENFPVPAALADADAGAEEPVCVGRADVPLSVIIIVGPALRIRFVYHGGVFDDDSVARLARHFTTVLMQMCTSASRRLSDISLLRADERHRLLVEWNATAAPGFDAVPLMQLLDEQARRTPDAVAFVDDVRSISIADLHALSNRLAWYLMGQGVELAPSSASVASAPSMRSRRSSRSSNAEPYPAARPDLPGRAAVVHGVGRQGSRGARGRGGRIRGPGPDMG